MLEGFAQAKTHYDEHSVNRVLLLSDGLANHGIILMEELQKIVANKYQNDHIALSTFGVGLDYNEDLMTNLAEYGKGNYYFIEEPDKIPEIFNSELNGLLSVIAQNSVLELSFEGAPVKMSKLLGFDYKEDGATYRVDFNDVFSEEKKAVLVELSLDKAIEKGDELEIVAKLTFDDVLNSYNRKTIEKKLTLGTTDNTTVYNESLNSKVANNKILFLSNDVFEAAVKAVDRNDYEKAKKLLEGNKLFFEESTKGIKVNKEVEDQMNMSNKYLDELDEIKRYTAEQKKQIQKASKSSNYELKKKKRY
ncbi:VWA domain-containing protein [Flammeovirgaceae bacterium SG7u.111]|nr:VWA domain-containing protein [Flammeovirgaceae bacterium SG7u.132]WPO37863.1 VWA domain-containing protein [Flammeovirgaceae bacterium SG7u.111]